MDTETLEVILPYNKLTHPPYTTDRRRMIKRASKKVNQWLKKLQPRFTEHDGIRLLSFEKRLDAAYLQYEIVRNKY